VQKVIQYDARNVHVGDAAQTQIGGNIRFMPIKDAYIQLQGMFFDRYYANFSPTSLQGSDGGKESWIAPSYFLLDLSAGYKFKIYDKYRAALNFNVLNLANIKYISDADNNAGFMDNEYTDFDAKSASVFMGMGRRFTASLKLYF
jgi:iron complex outermembrane receptor protein